MIRIIHPSTLGIVGKEHSRISQRACPWKDRQYNDLLPANMNYLLEFASEGNGINYDVSDNGLK